jgi:RimJ/RimL family protein N-acetyltransferase
MFLDGERLTLRTAQSDDYGFIARHLNNPTARHTGLQDIRIPFYEDDIAAIVEEQDDYHMFLACREGDPVGSAFLSDIDFEGRKAELGYWIVPEEQGNGYATEAAQLCLIHGFDELGLDKIWARTVGDNEASKRILEKLGFKQEGVLREHWYGFEDYVDEYRFGLLESER